MLPLIEDKQDELQALCRRFSVQRLDIFGSAAATPQTSALGDLDFLVSFEPLDPAAHADAYFGLLLALQDVFDRQIDLVEERAIRNPYFKEGVEASRELIYAVES